MSRIPCDLHEVGGSHGLCRCDTRRQVVQPLGAWRMALPRRPRGTSCHTCRSRWRPRRRQTAAERFGWCCSWQVVPYQVEVSRLELPARMIATRVSRLALLRLGRAPFHPCNERAADKSTRIGVRNRSATCVSAEAKAPLPCPSSSLLKAGPSMALLRIPEGGGRKAEGRKAKGPAVSRRAFRLQRVASYQPFLALVSS